MNTEYQIADIQVLPQRNLLIKDDERLSLEPRIMEVLNFLASRPREVVLRKDMITSIWSVQYGGDESLTRAISLLRKSFKKLGVQRQIIETIPKRGYRLATSVRLNEISETGSQSEFPLREGSHQNEKPAEILPSNPKVSNSAHLQKKSFHPLMAVIPMAVLCAGILIFFLRPSPKPESVAATPGQSVQPISSAPASDYEVKASQGDVATAIILTYLDGHIDRETAITTAARHLKIAQSQSPNTSDTLTAEGWLYYIQNQTDEALLKFETVTSRELLFGSAWLGKAFIYKDLNKEELALLSFDQAISIDAFSMTPRYAKAQYLFDQGEFSQALSEAKDILFFDSDHQNTLDLISKIKLKMN